MFENFSEMMLELFVSSLWETIIMVGVSGVVGGPDGTQAGYLYTRTIDANRQFVGATLWQR